MICKYDLQKLNFSFECFRVFIPIRVRLMCSCRYTTLLFPSRRSDLTRNTLRRALLLAVASCMSFMFKHSDLTSRHGSYAMCRNVSELHWSPAGRNIILAGLSGTQGAMEFFNVDDMSTLRLQQHFMCNNVKWDQTGRYACSWVDAHRDMDHGYVIWSFTGELLYRYALFAVCFQT